MFLGDLQWNSSLNLTLLSLAQTKKKRHCGETSRRQPGKGWPGWEGNQRAAHIYQPLSCQFPYLLSIPLVGKQCTGVPLLPGGATVSVPWSKLHIPPTWRVCFITQFPDLRRFKESAGSFGGSLSPFQLITTLCHFGIWWKTLKCQRVPTEPFAVGFQRLQMWMPTTHITVKRKIYIVLLLQSPSHELLRVPYRQNKRWVQSKKASKPTADAQNDVYRRIIQLLGFQNENNRY